MDCRNCLLDLTCRGRETHIPRHRSHNDQVNLFPRNPGIFHGLPCCRNGKGCGSLLYRNMSFFNPRAAPDPLIRGIHDLFKFCVMNCQTRKRTSRSYNLCSHFILSLSLSSANLPRIARILKFSESIITLCGNRFPVHMIKLL